jgi:uroporphyrinogen-III synthase
MGFSALLAPALRIETRTLHLPRTFRPQAVLVTSGNALASLPPALHGTALLAVGDATGARAQALGFAHARSAGGDAADLARLASEMLTPDAGALLLASGAGQGRALAKLLREKKFRVVHRVAYAARPVASLPEQACRALRAGLVEAALFFSAASARTTVAQFRRAGVAEAARLVDAVAISPGTAAALHLLPWRSIRVASRPDQDELLACLKPARLK